MARFTHPATTSEGRSEDGTWIMEGGTMGSGAVQPTFDGDPLFLGHYTLIGHMCHFSIEVSMSNITDFGEGQFYMTLPFQSHHANLHANGCLHDASTESQYAMLGHNVAGSDVISLQSIGSNGKHLPFYDGGPVKLAPEDSFHVSGYYEIEH